MLHTRSLAGVFVGALSVLTVASAQGHVLVVDSVAAPGVDYTTLQDAIDAADEGDTLLVRGGDYAAFKLSSKSLSIVADAGQIVRITGSTIVEFLGPSQSCVCLGVEFIGDLFLAFNAFQNQGTIWLENCKFRLDGSPGLGIFVGVSIQDSASVTLVHCDVRGWAGGPGLSAWLSGPSAACRVFGFETCISGGDGLVYGPSNPWSPGSGGTGVGVSNAEFYASGCSISGGNGSQGVPTSGGACAQGSGGDGLFMTGSAAKLRLLETTLAGGAGSTACGAEPVNGKSIESFGGVAEFLAGSAHGMTSAAPVREGQAIQATFNGVAGECVFVAYAATDMPGSYEPALAGPLLLGHPFVLLSLGTLPASGQIVYSTTLAELGPGVESVRLVSQPAFVDLAGAQVVLGAPSTIIGLDAAF
jgi:hypothetical protein